VPELIRSLVSRVRVFVKDRRRSPRLRVRLVFSLSINPQTNGNGSRRRLSKLGGHTRDISVHGLALNLPQVHLDGYHLAAEQRELQLRLELPDGAVTMRVISKRYERLEESELGCGYLIGARIVAIDGEDRERYLSFIKQGLAKQ
jgi:hypothetical protein